MKSKKKIIKFIDIGFWTYILIDMINMLKSGIEEGNFENNFGDIEFYLWVFCFAIFLLGVVLLKNIYITAIYIGFKIAYKKHSKGKLNKIDLKNNHYYRELIDNYSPATLSYIDDFKLEEKDLVATLLKLERKNKIIIGDTIETINNQIDDLSENEKYVFNQVKNNNLNNFNFIKFENEVIKDCLNQDILSKKDGSKKRMDIKIILSILIYFVLIIVFGNSADFINEFLQNESLKMISFILGFIIFLIIVGYPIIIISSVKAYTMMDKINPYVRNKKGKEINYKIEGLKNYIKDYSNLQLKEKEQIELWEDYLIYSVMFGININITDEIIKKIKSNEY